MPKVTMTFNLPEEREELETTQKAGAMHSCLWDTAQEVFRPARKHGYPDSRIQALIERLDSLAEKDPSTPKDEYGCAEDATHLISLLEKRFYEILSENDVQV